MKVLKFGGSSVGTAERMKHVASLINFDDNQLIVLSAMKGTTDKLYQLVDLKKKKHYRKSKQELSGLFKQYNKTADQLFKNNNTLQQARLVIQKVFGNLEQMLMAPEETDYEKEIVAQGEILSTNLFHLLLIDLGHESQLLNAIEFMKIKENGEPQMDYIHKKIKQKLASSPTGKVFITQGFICRNARKQMDNLKRGGSDYTASILGAVLNASEVQLWSDVDGFRNNDPRYVTSTEIVRKLSFEEAAELAYFGAKILHPLTVHPCRKMNIPVRLKNTLNPVEEGTLISNEAQAGEIKAVAAKDGLTVIKIQSDRMLMAYGFLRKVFEVFETYKTSIDVITTSEVGVSVTIDDTKYLEQIREALLKFSAVEIFENQSVLCVVGELPAYKKGIVYKAISALRDIPLRMISYGGSCLNVTFVLESVFKKEALNVLNENLLTLNTNCHEYSRSV